MIIRMVLAIRQTAYWVSRSTAKRASLVAIESMRGSARETMAIDTIDESQRPSVSYQPPLSATRTQQGN